MDMKHILQVLDKSSSRKVEGANDMRRFVSAVRILNQPIDEAGKPGDPGFKPNLQVPQAPPFPEGDFSKPGPYDLGNGEKLTVNQDGTRVHSSGAGTFTYDKAGKAIKYASPMFNGLSQEHDLATGNITVKYMNGPMNIVKTYDKTGKETGDSNAEYDMGVQKVAQQKTAGGQVQNTVTPAGGAPQPAPATEGKDDIRRFVSAVQVLNAPIEECSGYIPKNKKEAKDPRWSNALTVDIQPGAVEKNLKALSLAEGKKNFRDYLNEAEQGVEEVSLVSKLEWPEVVNKVNSAMKAMGWKGGRKGDDAYIFSSKGYETDDQYYFVIIESAGEGVFTYALGTVEEGDPHIDDAYKGKLPNTEASVSELMDEIRDGFGLNEDKQKGVDGKACWKGYKRMGTKKKGGKTVDNCVPTGKK